MPDVPVPSGRLAPALAGTQTVDIPSAAWGNVVAEDWGTGSLGRNSRDQAGD